MEANDDLSHATGRRRIIARCRSLAPSMLTTTTTLTTQTRSLNVTAAAQHLGVSVETVRRRLRNGVLAGTRTATPTGHVWSVTLPVDAVPATATPTAIPIPATSTTPALPVDAVAMLDARIADLRDEVASLRAMLDGRAVEVASLHRIIDAMVTANQTAARPWWKVW